MLDGQIAEFNKVFPNIKVTGRSIGIDTYVTALSSALASGEGPDTYNLEPGAMANQFGPLSEDLTPLFESVLGEEWAAKLSPGAVSELTVNGSVVGAPNLATGSGTLVVNLDLLEDLGIELPASFSSMDDLASWCKRVTEAGKDCIAMGAKDAWISLDVFRSVANSVEPGAFAAAVAGERPWTDPVFIEALSLWQAMFSNGVFQEGALGTGQYPDANNMWQGEQAVAIATGTWGAVDFVGATSIDQQTSAGVSDPTPLRFTISRFPAVGGTPVDIFSSVGSGTAVSADSQNKAAAAVWVRWNSLDVDGGQKLASAGLAGVPTLHGVVPEPEGIAYPELAESALAFTTARILASTESRQVPYPELSTAIGNALQSSATGVSSEQVAAELQGASEAVDRTK